MARLRRQPVSASRREGQWTVTVDDGAGQRIRIVVVLGTSVGGVGTHVRSVVDRLPRGEFAVTVVGPPETDEHFGFTSSGVDFVPVSVATTPRPDRDRSEERRVGKEGR